MEGIIVGFLLGMDDGFAVDGEEGLPLLGHEVGAFVGDDGLTEGK